MLKDLFRRKTRELTPSEIMDELSARLEAMGYRYDHNANKLIKDEIAVAYGFLSPESVSRESDICPRKIIFHQNYTYRYLDIVAQVTVEKPEIGVMPTDRIQFIEKNYHQDFPRDKDEPFPSVSVLKEMTVADVLAQPHPKPISSRIERLTRQAREFLAV